MFWLVPVLLYNAWVQYNRSGSVPRHSFSERVPIINKGKTGCACTGLVWHAVFVWWAPSDACTLVHTLVPLSTDQLVAGQQKTVVETEDKLKALLGSANEDAPSRYTTAA